MILKCIEPNLKYRSTKICVLVPSMFLLSNKSSGTFCSKWSRGTTESDFTINIHKVIVIGSNDILVKLFIRDINNNIYNFGGLVLLELSWNFLKLKKTLCQIQNFLISKKL